MSRKLDYWINSIEIEHTFDALKDFVICDQIVSTMNPELRLYVKERAPSSTEELLHLADSWSSARKKFQNGNSPNRFATKGKPFGESEETRTDTPPSPNPKDTLPSPISKSEIICHYCKRKGHYKSECLSRPVTTPFSPGRVQFCQGKEDSRKPEHMVEGTVNGVHVSTILLDTGCDCIIVSDKIIPNIDRKICKEKTIFDYLGRQDKFPVVKCLINCKYFNGWTDVVVAPLKFTSVLLGTVTPPEPSHFPANKIDTGKSESFSSNQVSTRFTPRLKGSSLNPLDAPPLVAMECTTEHFLESQNSCPTLENVRKNIVSNKCFKMKDGSMYKFVEFSPF